MSTGLDICDTVLSGFYPPKSGIKIGRKSPPPRFGLRFSLISDSSFALHFGFFPFWVESFVKGVVCPVKNRRKFWSTTLSKLPNLFFTKRTAVHQVRWSSSIEMSIHEHCKLKSYSIGDIKPVKLIIRYSLRPPCIGLEATDSTRAFQQQSAYHRNDNAPSTAYRQRKRDSWRTASYTDGWRRAHQPSLRDQQCTWWTTVGRVPNLVAQSTWRERYATYYRHKRLE